jgi:hypothetical protein
MHCELRLNACCSHTGGSAKAQHSIPHRTIACHWHLLPSKLPACTTSGPAYTACGLFNTHKSHGHGKKCYLQGSP